MDLDLNLPASSPPELSALAVFISTVDHGVIRSVHGYKVIKEGEEKEQEWVEREFLLSPASCHEITAPIAAPWILPDDRHYRPAFREGQTVGIWCCILAFDSVGHVVPSSPPPPMLSLSGNPWLKLVPCLYNDLEEVSRFQGIEEIPELIRYGLEKRSIRSNEQEKIPKEVGVTGPDSVGDSESCEEIPAPAKKQRRAGAKHVASICLVDIAQYFHLPIREASRTLKIGVSIMKRKCRQYGIPRWPHRKIKSLDSLIRDLEGVLDDTESDNVQEVVHQNEKESQQAAVKAITRRKRMLENEKEAIQKSPTTDLMTETKQFREDVFKRRYKARTSVNM